MSYPTRDNYTIVQTGTHVNLWIPSDNDSFKEAWWHQGSENDLPLDHRCLYRNGKGGCSINY